MNSQPITVDSQLTRSSEQVSCDISGETVILSLKNAAYYGLDPVATRVWELLCEPRTVADVCDVLLSEYEDVDAQRCASEVIALSEQLVEWGLVEIAPVSSSGVTLADSPATESRAEH